MAFVSLNSYNNVCTADIAVLRRLQESGVILLTICILDMPSYTYAVKAQRLLNSRGYQCRISRREKSSDESCGYSLRISGDCRRASEILDKYSIPHTPNSSGGANNDKL